MAIEVKIVGLEAMLKKLSPTLYAGPLRKFWERASIAVQSRAREKSPVDTGRLRASIMYEIDGATPPLYAKVGTDVFYAPFQEFGTKFMPGKHYLQGGFEDSAGTIQGAVDALGGEISSAWGA
jgi:HK97 gp10 family phage protein